MAICDQVPMGTLICTCTRGEQSTFLRNNIWQYLSESPAAAAAVAWFISNINNLVITTLEKTGIHHMEQHNSHSKSLIVSAVGLCGEVSRDRPHNSAHCKAYITVSRARSLQGKNGNLCYKRSFQMMSPILRILPPGSITSLYDVISISFSGSGAYSGSPGRYWWGFNSCGLNMSAQGCGWKQRE